MERNLSTPATYNTQLLDIWQQFRAIGALSCDVCPEECLVDGRDEKLEIEDTCKVFSYGYISRNVHKSVIRGGNEIKEAIYF
jgi:hypothetical protein